MRHLASAQGEQPACVFIMDTYKATFSVVWRASLCRLAIVYWIGCINAIKCTVLGYISIYTGSVCLRLRLFAACINDKRLFSYALILIALSMLMHNA